MINKEEYESRRLETEKLLEKNQIRRGLKTKLFCTYPKLFEGLFDLLSLPESNDFFFLIMMHFGERTIEKNPGDRNDIRINWWQEPNINYALLFQEIFDDYWASFLCFQHGFTKQSTEILRNTLEIMLNVYYVKFCSAESDKALSRWSMGERVSGTISSVIEAVKKTEFSKAENIGPHLEKLYSTLSTATHSDKNMMTSLTMPGGIWVKEKMMFEPFIVLQTRSLFLWSLETELKMMRHFFDQDEKTWYTQKILDSIGKMEKELEKHSDVIESVKKGYILHREETLLASGKSVLFSLKVNNDWELAGKHAKSLGQEEKEELERKMQDILLREAT